MPFGATQRALETHRFRHDGQPYQLQVIDSKEVQVDEDPWLSTTQPGHNIRSLRISSRLYKWFFRVGRAFVPNATRAQLVRLIAATYWKKYHTLCAGTAKVRHLHMRWSVFIESSFGIWAEERMIEKHRQRGQKAYNYVKYHFIISFGLFHWFQTFYHNLTGQTDDRITHALVVLYKHGIATLNPPHHIIHAYLTAEAVAIEHNQDPMPTYNPRTSNFCKE